MFTPNVKDSTTKCMHCLTSPSSSSWQKWIIQWLNTHSALLFQKGWGLAGKNIITISQTYYYLLYYRFRQRFIIYIFYNNYLFYILKILYEFFFHFYRATHLLYNLLMMLQWYWWTDICVYLNIDLQKVRFHDILSRNMLHLEENKYQKEEH